MAKKTSKVQMVGISGDVLDQVREFCEKNGCTIRWFVERATEARLAGQQPFDRAAVEKGKR